MEEVLVPIVVIPTIFIGLPWLILHYMTKWKTAATLTREDENLLDELHDIAPVSYTHLTLPTKRIV